MKKELLLQAIRGRAVVGIDEVGRGSWAGPLVVGAVMLDADIPGLADSKVLNKSQRNILAERVKSLALFCSTGWVWPDEVDELGLTRATSLAISRAIAGMDTYDFIIVDGSIQYIDNNPRAFTLVKADALVPAVSAASIVAKVARDQYMADQVQQYPDYSFDTHVGYGTAKHKQAIVEHGVTPLHRMSYKPVQKYLEGSEV